MAIFKYSRKPPYVVVTLPGPHREPYIIWDKDKAEEFIKEAIQCMNVFPGLKIEEEKKS